MESAVHSIRRIDEVTFENLPSVCDVQAGFGVGLVNGVLAGTGALSFSNYSISCWQVATEGFFWSLPDLMISPGITVSVAFGVHGGG
jgi:hypothetical protein